MSLLQALRRCQFHTSLPYAVVLRHFATAAQLEPIVLRPYQDSCLQACLDALGKGLRRIGVSLPTGAGKTTVFVSLISRIPPRGGDKRAKRALIIVNSIELARQSAAQVERLFPELSVEIEQGTKHNASGAADV
jgi:ATP-dependent helicase IRC3